MTRTDRACNLEDIERADDIGVNISARIFETVANAGLRREMDDHLRFVRFGDSVQTRKVLQQELMGAKRIAARQDGIALALERHVVIAGHPVNPGHQITLGTKAAGQMKTDESRCAGDQDAHRASLLSNRTKLQLCAAPAVFRAEISAESTVWMMSLAVSYSLA